MNANMVLSRNEHRNEHGASDSEPIHEEALFARCMGNTSFALALLAELDATGRQQVDVIASHVDRGDCAAIAEVAHSLKGASAIVGAEPLRAVAAEMESLARAGTVDRLRELSDDLRWELDRCLAHIRVLHDRLQPR